MLAVGWTCETRVCIRVMRHSRLGTINWTDRLAILMDACHVQTPSSRRNLRSTPPPPDHTARRLRRAGPGRAGPAGSVAKRRIVPRAEAATCAARLRRPCKSAPPRLYLSLFKHPSPSSFRPVPMKPCSPAPNAAAGAPFDSRTLAIIKSCVANRI